MTPHLTTLLLQIGVILVVARALGWIFHRFHQPKVVGEMAAGILLGPSLLGWIAPGAASTLFPEGSLEPLRVLSQVGLILFMFLVGLELDTRGLRGRGRAVVVTSYFGILAPFLLGILLAFHLYTRLSDPGVKFTHFALFLGTAMSITAFPVLARILIERDLLQSRVGTVAIACAAADDVTAWHLLAAVVLLTRAAGLSFPFWMAALGSLATIVLLWLVARPALRGLGAIYRRRGTVTPDLLALILLIMLACAWATERLGIHAVFGAFLAGVILPKERGFVEAVSEKLKDLTVVLLLPLFFAFTGLRTSIGLLSGPALWIDCVLVIAVATAGKFGGVSLAARLTGSGWREAAALGILMNTRGLMELVILNVGRDVGVISAPLFAMMVLMALVTTFLTTPLLEWFYPLRLRHSDLQPSGAVRAP